MKALLIAAALTGCAATGQVEILRPPIPAALLRPCVEPVGAITTPRELADAYVKRGLALKCANGKISAISEIVEAE